MRLHEMAIFMLIILDSCTFPNGYRQIGPRVDSLETCERMRVTLDNRRAMCVRVIDLTEH